MKRFKKTKATANVGVAFVQGVVSQEGSIFRPISEENDIGIDGYIEFVEDEIATGILVGVQIKTGSSYLVQRRDGQYFEVAVSNDDLAHWSIQPIPTALIVYAPEAQLSGWLDITGYLHANPSILEKKSTTLSIRVGAAPFSIGTFRGPFRRTFQKYRTEVELLRLKALLFDFTEMVFSDSPSEKFNGILGLLSHSTSRFSRVTCFLLLEHLFHKDKSLRVLVSDALSRYLPASLVGYHPHREIVQYIESALQNFGKREVALLLETVWLDEYDFTLDYSLADSIYAIITSIPNYEHYLSDIAMDANQSNDARTAALGIALEHEVRPVATYLVKNFDNVNWGNISEEARWFLDRWFEKEANSWKLSEVVELEGYDSYYLISIIRDASMDYLSVHESILYQILERTTDPIIYYEANSALTKLMHWRHPPEKYMQRLL